VRSTARAIGVMFMVTFPSAVGVGGQGEDVARQCMASPTSPGRSVWATIECASAVIEKTDAAWAHIPWRRRDRDPEKKATLVVDAAPDNRCRTSCG